MALTTEHGCERYERISWGGEKFRYTEDERDMFAPVELELLGPEMLRALIERRKQR